MRCAPIAPTGRRCRTSGRSGRWSRTPAANSTPGWSRSCCRSSSKKPTAPSGRGSFRRAREGRAAGGGDAERHFRWRGMQALALADRRMYADKQRGRQSASSQTADVLVRALTERVPDLERPLSDVADLATATARRLGLELDEIELIQRAAGLHDIGKLAIPDSILNKPTELDPDEAMFMRSHPVIGERILAAAPCLAPVARLVRVSHEAFDGSGHPDGLAENDIPLGS